MNHESKRLLEALDARIERMTEKMLAYQEQQEWVAASVSGAWVDATTQARDDVREAVEDIEALARFEGARMVNEA